MKIKITLSDILCGKMGDEFGCPIALALKRAHPNKYILVKKDGFFIGDVEYDTSLKIKEFIADFDFGFVVHPFEFDTDDLEPDNVNEEVIL